MNFDYYGLECLARGYVRERELEARRARQLASLPRKVRSADGPNPFLTLLGLWVRFTALLIRYPVNPRRISAKLVAIGFSAHVVGASRSMGGGAHVGR